MIEYLVGVVCGVALYIGWHYWETGKLPKLPFVK